MFLVNDVVKAFGMTGKVVEIDEEVVITEFEGSEVVFGLDGKLEDWHAESSLVLISRPVAAPQVVTRFANIYEGGTLGSRLHNTEAAARAKSGPGLLRIIPVEIRLS